MATATAEHRTEGRVGDEVPAQLCLLGQPIFAARYWREGELHHVRLADADLGASAESLDEVGAKLGEQIVLLLRDLVEDEGRTESEEELLHYLDSRLAPVLMEHVERERRARRHALERLKQLLAPPRIEWKVGPQSTPPRSGQPSTV